MKTAKITWLSQWNGPVIIVGAIAILLILGLPAIQQAREAARRTQSKNNLKQIGLALHSYVDTFGMLPPGGVFDADGKAFHGWMTSITPFIDASPWYNQVNFNIPWDHPDQIEHFQPGHSPAYLNPSISLRCGNDGLIRTHYAGSDLLFYHNSFTRFSDLTSGTSQTMCVGDALGNFEPFGNSYGWRSVESLNSTPSGFGCSVRNVTQMLMADGEVRAFSHATDTELFRSLRGENSKWQGKLPDVSRPLEPDRLSPPTVCLWVEPHSGSSLLGVQDESQQIVRAWFLNSGSTWHEGRGPTCDKQANLLLPHESLRNLKIGDALSDQGILILKEMPLLESVLIRGSSVTDRGFQILSQFPQLKRLDLAATALGDAGWNALAKAPNLHSIEIEFNWSDQIRFSPQAVVNFLNLKPDCDVTISRGRTIEIAQIRELAKIAYMDNGK